MGFGGAWWLSHSEYVAGWVKRNRVEADHACDGKGLATRHMRSHQRSS